MRKEKNRILISVNTPDGYNHKGFVDHWEASLFYDNMSRRYGNSNVSWINL